jgi:hypothetical protein
MPAASALMLITRYGKDNLEKHHNCLLLSIQQPSAAGYSTQFMQCSGYVVLVGQKSYQLKFIRTQAGLFNHTRWKMPGFLQIGQVLVVTYRASIWFVLILVDFLLKLGGGGGGKVSRADQYRKAVFLVMHSTARQGK